MKTSPSQFRGPSGSVLLYVLVLVALVSLLFAGWIHLMVARGDTTEIMSATMQQRISAANARQLFRQYLRNQVPDRPVGSLAETGLAGGWGSVEVLPWEKNVGNWQQSTPLGNSLRPLGSSGFHPPISAVFRWSTPVPVAGGGVAEFSASANAVVRTRTFNEFQAGVTTGSPFIVTANTPKPAEEDPTWFAVDDAGEVTINLPALDPDFPAKIQVMEPTRLVLLGSDSPDTSPVEILVDDTAVASALIEVRFVGNNLRPLTLGIGQLVVSGRAEWNFSEGSLWRMQAILQDAPIEINHAAALLGTIWTGDHADWIEPPAARVLWRPHRYDILSTGGTL
jgi:hypothetical protein